MSSSLSAEEVSHRLIRLRNIERLHGEQRKRMGLLEENIGLLKKENTLLRQENHTLKTTLEDFKLQIEELRVMVFGKKKETHDVDDDLTPPTEKVERTQDSYRRPTPRDEEVTETKPHSINECTYCHGTLSKKKTITFFEEDIPIPVKKIVIQHCVEKGYCSVCKKWSTSIPLPSHRVILGNNIQKYICYLSVICRLSYTQIQELIIDTYQMDVSQGEITKILDRIATNHRPEYEQQKVRIRGKPGTGLDETGYSITSQSDSLYAWVMVDTETGEAVYIIGVSRGGGHVSDLQGENYQGFTVTDDFVAYKKLPHHQLCFAHLIRKFRDLARSDELPDQHMYYVEQYKLMNHRESHIPND
jgi:regulator of replication initiation timing